VLANHVDDKIRSGLATAGVSTDGSQSGGNLDLKDLPGFIQTIVRAAYGDSFGTLFLIAAAVSVLTLLAVLFVREVPLRNTVELRPTDASEEPAQPEQTHRSPSPEVEPVTSTGSADLDDPSSRLATAALDVLTAAQDQARRQLPDSQHHAVRLVERLDQAGSQVDAAVSRFRHELEQIRSSAVAQDSGASLAQDGSGGSALRSYEYGLLLNAQQTADRVTRLARLEAERLLANAEAEVAALEQRISELRRAESELVGQVSDQLRANV
jgi:hypothetical protein